MFQPVVLSYNHPEITSRCIQSVLAFGCKPLVIHNGSELKHVASLRARFADLEHLVMPENRGYAGGANFALRAGFRLAPWVLFLTNDCELVELAAPPSAPGFYGLSLLRRDRRSIESVGGAFHVVTGEIYHLKTVAEFAALNGHIRPYIPGHGFLLHESVFADLEGFDESFFTYLEDVDFSFRCADRGWPVTILPDFHLAHAGGKTCRKDRRYSGFYFQRNRRWLLARYSPSPIWSVTLWHWQTLRRLFWQICRRDWVGVRFSWQLLVGRGRAD